VAISAKELVRLLPRIDVIKPLACWRPADKAVIFMIGAELPARVKRPEELFAPTKLILSNSETL
jgi:hypothetical protein